MATTISLSSILASGNHPILTALKNAGALGKLTVVTTPVSPAKPVTPVVLPVPKPNDPIITINDPAGKTPPTVITTPVSVTIATPILNTAPVGTSLTAVLGNDHPVLDALINAGATSGPMTIVAPAIPPTPTPAPTVPVAPVDPNEAKQVAAALAAMIAQIRADLADQNSPSSLGTGLPASVIATVKSENTALANEKIAVYTFSAIKSPTLAQFKAYALADLKRQYAIDNIGAGGGNGGAATLAAMRADQAADLATMTKTFASMSLSDFQNGQYQQYYSYFYPASVQPPAQPVSTPVDNNSSPIAVQAVASGAVLPVSIITVPIPSDSSVSNQITSPVPSSPSSHPILDAIAAQPIGTIINDIIDGNHPIIAALQNAGASGPVTVVTPPASAPVTQVNVQLPPPVQPPASGPSIVSQAPLVTQVTVQPGQSQADALVQAGSVGPVTTLPPAPVASAASSGILVAILGGAALFLGSKS